MIKNDTTISNKLGLHARASAKLTKLAGSFPCEVWMSKGERRVNAKSTEQLHSSHQPQHLVFYCACCGNGCCYFRGHFCAFSKGFQA